MSPQLFTSASDWTPAVSNLHPQVATLIYKDLQIFDHRFRLHNVSPNLSSEESVALKELTKNKTIIIKPADKGSSIVIMDREQYLWEGYRQLNDAKYYLRLQTPIYPDTICCAELLMDPDVGA